MSSSVCHEYHVVCRAFKFDPETKLHILELFDRDLAFLPARFVHQVEKARWGQVSPLLLGAQLCKHAFYFPLSRRNLLAVSSVFTNTSKVVKVYLSFSSCVRHSTARSKP